MNAVSVERSRWSRRNWAYAIVGVLIVQALLIALLGQRQALPPKVVAFGLTIDMPESGVVGQAADSDPTTFALPNWNGFSREGWLAFDRPEFKPTDWTEPPQWLALETTDLGNSLHDFILSNTIPPLLIADKPVAALTGQSASVGNMPLRSESDLVLEGELARRSTADPIDLPSWRHPDLLTNTVVHAVVDRSGRILTATLLAGSGHADADAFAVRVSKKTRFRPVNGPRSPSDFASGALVFRWHTLPPTNAAPAASFSLP